MVVLPHMGSATVEGRIEMGERAIVNIQTLVNGLSPPGLMLPGMPWTLRPSPRLKTQSPN